MPPTLLWYDLETFGTGHRWDRIAQYASVRTDLELQEIQAPTVRYCRLSPDYVPNLYSCLVTRITPQEANRRGVRECELASLVHEEMSRPGTCTAGFNSIRFDDEFVRSLFYRNFYDPYEREWRGGNSRWDIIDLLRMCHDLRPEGLHWVHDESGVPRFALEELAAANGLPTANAHDALADVRTTMELARLLRRKQPQLYDYYFRLRNKALARSRLNLRRMEPVVHTSGMFTSERGCTSIVIPLSVHPAQENVVIAYDLRRDPADWLDCDTDQIRRRVFTRKEELDPGERIPFKGIHVNRCPAIAPLSTLPPERARILGLDVDACLANAQTLRRHSGIIQKVRAVYSGAPQPDYDDVDLRLYTGGFFIDADRDRFPEIRRSAPESLLATPPHLHDERAAELIWRYVCRNHPEALSPAEADRWRSHCATRILTPEPSGAMDIGTYRQRLRNLMAAVDTPARDKPVLKSLLDYGAWLEKTVLGA